MALVGGFVALVFLYSLVSRRLARTPLTAPVLFTAAGFLLRCSCRSCGTGGRPEALPAGRGSRPRPAALHRRQPGRLRLLRGMRSLPLRLLGGGMLLTILLGGLAALVVFRQLSVWEAGILAAILAPTDAGLGQVIVHQRARPGAHPPGPQRRGRAQRRPLRALPALLHGTGRGGGLRRRRGARPLLFRAARRRRPHRPRGGPGGRLAAGAGAARRVDGALRAAARRGRAAARLHPGLRARGEHVHRGVRRRPGVQLRFADAGHDATEFAGAVGTGCSTTRSSSSSASWSGGSGPDSIPRSCSTQC